MKLYNADLSPNALRVRAVAFELGIELEMVDIDIRAGDTKTEAFLALNPNGKVPVLEDGDFVLWESRAINTYLASLKPERGLYPDDPKTRAKVDQWSYWQAIHLGPAMQRISFERVVKKALGRGEPNEEAIAGQIKDTEQFLGVFEIGLGDNDWIAGDLTVADFALATTFQYRKPAKISLDAFPKVEAWISRMDERESWQKAIAPLSSLINS
jgi:glutathione S-transferase